MAGIHKHIYKRKAMTRFGEERGVGEPFRLAELLEYMRTFKGVNGKVHKSVPTTHIQLTSLIRIHPHFRFLPSAGNRGMWVFMGSEEE
jgi:hypothetical protein|tara:strand:+ start:1507 stop:1770 length:264 start_codon:yes stop_codon:yes gene_type:complete